MQATEAGPVQPREWPLEDEIQKKQLLHVKEMGRSRELSRQLRRLLKAVALENYISNV
jgi:hypothetical protein